MDFIIRVLSCVALAISFLSLAVQGKCYIVFKEVNTRVINKTQVNSQVNSFLHYVMPGLCELGKKSTRGRS